MKVNSSLPKGALPGLETEMIKNPALKRMLVVQVGCARLLRDLERGGTEATIKIIWAEEIDDVDVPAIYDLMDKAKSRRSGQVDLFTTHDDDDDAPVTAELLELEAGVGDVEHHPDCDGDCLDGETIDIGEPDDDPFADDNDEVAA